MTESRTVTKNLEYFTELRECNQLKLILDKSNVTFLAGDGSFPDKMARTFAIYGIPGRDQIERGNSIPNIRIFSRLS